MALRWKHLIRLIVPSAIWISRLRLCSARCAILPAARAGRGIHHMDATAGGQASVSVVTFVRFVKGVLALPNANCAPPSRVRQDLFDVSAEP